MEIQKINLDNIDFNNQQLNKELVITLMNTVETLVLKLKTAEERIKYLEDEISKLKGTNGKPEVEKKQNSTEKTKPEKM